MLKLIEHCLAAIGAISCLGTLAILLNIFVLSGGQADQDDFGA